jgi:hypothetical protein
VPVTALAQLLALQADGLGVAKPRVANADNMMIESFMMGRIEL